MTLRVGDVVIYVERYQSSRHTPMRVTSIQEDDLYNTHCNVLIAEDEVEGVHRATNPMFLNGQKVRYNKDYEHAGNKVYTVVLAYAERVGGTTKNLYLSTDDRVLGEWEIRPLTLAETLKEFKGD